MEMMIFLRTCGAVLWQDKCIEWPCKTRQVSWSNIAPTIITFYFYDRRAFYMSASSFGHMQAALKMRIRKPPLTEEENK